MKLMAITAGVMALAGVAFARDGGKSGARSAFGMGAERFVYQAAMANLFEIEATGRAEHKTSNPQYEDFAKMIIADYTNLSAGLKKRVDILPDVAIPTTLDYEHQRELAELNSVPGTQFENDYRQIQIEGNRQTLRLFRDFASNGSNTEDAALKSWAKASIPILEKDLQRAEALPKDSSETIATGRVQGRTDRSGRALVDQAAHFFKRWKNRIVPPGR